MAIKKNSNNKPPQESELESKLGEAHPVVIAYVTELTAEIKTSSSAIEKLKAECAVEIERDKVRIYLSGVVKSIASATSQAIRPVSVLSPVAHTNPSPWPFVTIVPANAKLHIGSIPSWVRSIFGSRA